MNCEHNTPEHQDIIDAHFAEPKPFFMDFRKPDHFSTFTWNGFDPLENLLEKHDWARYDLMLVGNQALKGLLQDIEQSLRAPFPNDGRTIGLEQFDDAAAYIAVWSDPNTDQSLVGVASCLNQSWGYHKNDQIIRLIENTYSADMEDVFSHVEYLLRNLCTIPMGFLTVLGSTHWSEPDPTVRLEQLVAQWNFEEQFEEDISESLVGCSVQSWVTEQQKQRLVQAIGHVSVPRKTKAL